MTETALLQFVGRLHPMLLHLPIGLWIGLALLEFGGTLVRRRAPRATIATLAWLAAVSGILSAVAGWVLAQEGYSGDALEPHRWLGVAAAAVGLLAASVAALQSRRPFGVLLAAEVGILLIAGHLGSEMTHGLNWLSEPFVAKAEPSPEVAGTATAGAAEPTFAAAVLPLLHQRCGKCHGETKPKGKLSLHTEAAIQKGGKNGAVIAAGKPDDSELLRRLLLPLDDEDHMPPEDKPQPTAAEVAVLRAWIAAGAPFQGPFDAGAVALATPDAHAPSATPDAHAPTEGPATVDPATGDPATVDPAIGDPATADPASDTPAPKAPTSPPAPASAVAALHERLVHAVPVAEGEPWLWIDFAAIAPTMSEADARMLLTPVAPWVQDLGLARVPVGNDLLALCARMPMLTRLDLRSTRVTTAGLQTLKDHPRLESLVLAETRLDDQAADALLAMPALRTVHLWKAGLSEPALQRLRERGDLTVETGEQPGGKALEVEPAPRLVKGGAPAAPPSPAAEPASPSVEPLKPVNTVCPVSGKAVDARFVIVHEQRVIGFCCEKCAASFWAEPARFPVGN